MTVVATQPSAAASLLAAYLAQLAANPLRTKALTSGTLSGLQEITATKLSGMPKSKNPDDFILGINKRVVQMALYGTFFFPTLLSSWMCLARGVIVHRREGVRLVPYILELWSAESVFGRRLALVA